MNLSTFIAVMSLSVGLFISAIGDMGRADRLDRLEQQVEQMSTPEPRPTARSSRSRDLGVNADLVHPRRTLTTPPPSRGRGAPASGTALDTTCYVWTGNRTASGVWPRPGMAASNLYPFGTRLRVERVGVVTIADRIGHGSQLDIYMTDRAACLRFGRQRLAVQVIR